jgi:hypothetical protein
MRWGRIPVVEAAPFFIVGSGRSGSTLLRMMLICHSRLTIPTETWYLIPLVKQFSLHRPLNPEEISSAVSIITGHYRWPDLKLDTQEFRQRVNLLSRPRVSDIAEVVYRWHMESEGKPRWGDKTPVYIEIVPQLARMFPNARFIHLVRDGRDVAKSFQATGWVTRWLHDNTSEWNRALACYWRWARSEFRDRILLVRYEDLVLETETTLREICRFIGEEFEPQMLAWEGKVDEQVSPREEPYQRKLKQRIGAEGVARWKREMSGWELFVAESFMASHLARLGYELRYRGPLWAPVFAATRLCCRMFTPALQSAIRVKEHLDSRLRST